MNSDNVENSNPGQNDESIFVPQYYHPVFFQIMQRQRLGIEQALISRPANIRQHHFLSKLPVDRWVSGDEAWQIGKSYLDVLESEMKKILSSHSVFFWLHIYRRIGVSLFEKHDGRTDARTVGLVRQIVELAISKYGSLDKSDDLALSTEVSFKDVLGGLLKREWLKQGKSTVEGAAAWKASFGSAPQWVLVKFQSSDLLQAYAAEGLAYDYWRTTALMRGIGKGVSIRRGLNNWAQYQNNEVLTRLIEVYDARTEKNPFSTSLAGSLFNGAKGSANSPGSGVLIAQYNINQVVNSHFPLVSPGGSSLTTNFTLGMFEMHAFRDAHAHLANAFEVRNGFSMDIFLGCLWGISNLVLYPGRVLDALNGGKPDYKLTNPFGANYFNLLQRAYGTLPHDKDELARDVRARANLLNCQLIKDAALKEIRNCLESLTLVSENRMRSIGLWSGGRCFPIIPFGPKATVIDIQGIILILFSLFVGVRDKLGKRGESFETAFRNQLKARGHNLVHFGTIKSRSGLEREIDAAVRVGETLILFECKATERPLDYEIGKPSVINHRSRDLDGKVDQVLTLVEFVRTYMSGTNYDFSWAREIRGFVVSPFVEWTWDLSDRLWEKADLARIISSDEAFSIVKELEASTESS